MHRAITGAVLLLWGIAIIPATIYQSQIEVYPSSYYAFSGVVSIVMMFLGYKLLKSGKEKPVVYNSTRNIYMIHRPTGKVVRRR